MSQGWPLFSFEIEIANFRLLSTDIVWNSNFEEIVRRSSKHRNEFLTLNKRKMLASQQIVCTIKSLNSERNEQLVKGDYTNLHSKINCTVPLNQNVNLA